MELVKGSAVVGQGAAFVCSRVAPTLVGSLSSDCEGQIGSVSRDYKRKNTRVFLDLSVYATVVLTQPVAA